MHEYIDPMPSSLSNPALLLHKLASQCAVCRSWPAHPVCAACVSRFSPWVARCASCAVALPAALSHRQGESPLQCGACIRQAPPLHACFAAVTYGYPWSTLLADYKFGNESGWAGFFADLLLQTPGLSGALLALEASDLIIPMPLSAQRLESRGFNQAWELVRAVASRSGSPGQIDARLLLRIRHTPPQTQLKREARLQNVKGAFVVDPLRAAELRHRRVVLVDDVMTSGASLFAAAQALRDAGAAHVTGLVLARTE